MFAKRVFVVNLGLLFGGSAIMHPPFNEGIYVVRGCKTVFYKMMCAAAGCDSFMQHKVFGSLLDWAAHQEQAISS